SWRNFETGNPTKPGFPRHWGAGILCCLCAAIRCWCSGNDRLVHIDVGDGRDADARRRDDVDGVDAAARPDVARPRRNVSEYGDCDEGVNDAAVICPNAATLSTGRAIDTRGAPRSADCNRERRLLPCLDPVRYGCFSAWLRAGEPRDAAAGTGARRTDRVRSA